MPLWNFTPLRSVKVKVLPSSLVLDLRGQRGTRVVLFVDRHQRLEHVVDDLELDQARGDVRIERARAGDIGVGERAALLLLRLAPTGPCRQQR